MIALQDQNEVIGVSCSCLRTPEGTANDMAKEEKTHVT